MHNGATPIARMRSLKFCVLRTRLPFLLLLTYRPQVDTRGFLPTLERETSREGTALIEDIELRSARSIDRDRISWPASSQRKLSPVSRRSRVKPEGTLF